jgi:hypothetical protein
MSDAELFLEAAENGDLPELKSIFKRTDDPNELLSYSDKIGNDAFLAACSYGNLECAKWLLRQGTDGFQKNMADQNAIALATKNKHTELQAWLTDEGFGTDATVQAQKKIGDSSTSSSCSSVSESRQKTRSILRESQIWDLLSDVSENMSKQSAIIAKLVETVKQQSDTISELKEEVSLLRQGR